MGSMKSDVSKHVKPHAAASGERASFAWRYLNPGLGFDQARWGLYGEEGRDTADFGQGR